MLTQTLRGMARDGLGERTIYPSVPPKVEYRLTALGMSLKPLLMLVSDWAEAHLSAVREARATFDRKSGPRP